MKNVKRVFRLVRLFRLALRFQICYRPITALASALLVVSIGIVISTVAAFAAGYCLRISHELRARAAAYRRMAEQLERVAEQEHLAEHHQRQHAARWN